MSNWSKSGALSLLLIICGVVYYGSNSTAPEIHPADGSRQHIELPSPLSRISHLPPPAAGAPETDTTDSTIRLSDVIDSLIGEEVILTTSTATLVPKVVQSEPAWINVRQGTLQQCEGLTEGFNDHSAAALQVYSDFIPSGSNVHCSKKATVVINEEDVFFIYIVYGDLRGCDPHCYASQLCAVNDGRKSYLFSSQWYGYEEPINLILECPDLVGELTGNTNLFCDPKPSGYHHPAARGSNVISLYSSVETNVFRYCFM